MQVSRETNRLWPSVHEKEGQLGRQAAVAEVDSSDVSQPGQKPWGHKKPMAALLERRGLKAVCGWDGRDGWRVFDYGGESGGQGERLVCIKSG